MDNLVMLAKIFGPLVAISGFWCLTYRRELHKSIESLKKNIAEVHFEGSIYLLIGLTIVNLVPYFPGNLGFFVPLFGWLLIVLAIMNLFLPGLYTYIFIKNAEYVTPVFSLVMLIWGLLMVWVGFFATRSAM